MGEEPPRLDAIFAHPFLDVLLPRFEECLRDADGRPLGEANAPEAARLGATFMFRTCPYPGSRRGARMNMSALLAMGPAWDETLALLAQLRAAFLTRYPVAMNYLLLSRLAIFLTLFSGWLVRTRRVAWHSVPRSVSGLFKAAQGLYFTANDAMRDGGAEAAFATVGVDEFLARTEAHGLFRVGGRACAGPPEMIRRFVHHAIDGSPDEPRGGCLDLPPDALLAAADYSGLRLRAQQADQVRMLQGAASLARARGVEWRGDSNLLASLARQSGFEPAASPRTCSEPVDSELEALVRPDAPRAALLLARELFNLFAEHGAYAAALQGQIDATLGVSEAARFAPADQFALLGAFGPDPILAGAGRFLDVTGLAALIGRRLPGAAPAQATCRRQ